MAKITIPAVSGGYNLTTDVNVRLQQVEDELNDKVLYRTNPVGEANSLSNDVDMNNNDILNAKDVYILDSLGQATSFNATIDNIRELLAKNTSWNNRGVWTTATAYNVNDIWSYGALWYIVTTAYTSGVDAPTDIGGSNVSPLTGSIGTDFDQIPLNADIVYPIEAVQNIAGLIGTQDGQQINMKGWHPDSDVGGGVMYWDAAKLKSAHNGGLVFSPTVPYSTTINDYLNGVGETDSGGSGCWVRVDHSEVWLSWFGAVADFNTTTRTGTDNKNQLIAAVASLGGTQTIVTEYIYEPAKPLRIEKGNFGFNLTGSDRILVDRNNIIIRGSGMFNTNLYHFGSSNVAEFIRFKEAYSCELSHLTLDGGLPFTPAGTESYGVDVPVTLDQVAHFISKELNIVNYRIRGVQCIHLWESEFDDLRIFNGGFFGTGAAPSACIAFDDRGKESTFFPGSESNQIKFGKVAFGGVGTLVKATSPCFNISFDFVVAEGRTWPVNYSSQGESKWILSGLSSGFVVHHCWSYHHDQVTQTTAKVFDLQNAGDNCKFLNYKIYQEIQAGSPNYLETPFIIGNTSAYPVELNLTIYDAGIAQSVMFDSAAAGSLLTGDIYYNSDVSRTIDSFVGTQLYTNFDGNVFYTTGGFTTTPPAVLKIKGISDNFSYKQGVGSFKTAECIGSITYNGTADTTQHAVGASVTKSGTGQYSCVFDTARSVVDYSVTGSIAISNLGDQFEISGLTASGFTFSIRDHSGTYHDSSIICINVNS